MNGEIIYFDTDRGVGFITGTDGNRYVFDRADLRGADRIAKGAKVSFTVDGDRARLVRQTGGRVAEAQAPVPEAVRTGSAGSVPSVTTRTLADDGIQEPGAGHGVVTHFLRCLTANYANFRGRARRKEFWSFALGSVVLVAIALFVGLTLDSLAGNMSEVPTDGDFSVTGTPFITVIASGIVWIVLVVPSVAVTVRRIHDIGLSGWFFLVNFIPSVGSLIILVFMLIPTQRHPNKWGPVPAGIRL